ncbi:hypothetical protein [Nonomuraea sp. NPDC049309]|uniref:hypothetical protein n=1 Tax=Nonomuraea sp. NPDC049309 TaxID=3364350 RepID=UPI0037181852
MPIFQTAQPVPSSRTTARSNCSPTASSSPATSSPASTTTHHPNGSSTSTASAAAAKSLLLRHLEKRSCLRTDRWEDIRGADDTELLDHLAEHGRPVPVARIDFGARPAGENRPQEAFSGLFTSIDK